MSLPKLNRPNLNHGEWGRAIMQKSLQKRLSFNRLYAGLLIIAFLVVSSVAIITYWSYQKTVSELVIERDRELIQLSASRLKEEMEKYTELLQAISRDPGLQNANIAVQTRTLKNASARLDVFDGGVLLLDNFGRVIAAEPSRPSTLGRDLSSRLYFSELLSGTSVYYSNAVADGPGLSQVIVISTPIIGENGKFLGALAGMFMVDQSSLSAFYASIVRLRLGQNGTTYVLDGEGRKLYQSGLTEGNEINRAVSLQWLDVEADVGALRTRDEENNDIVAAYARIPSTQWVLVSEDDWGMLADSNLNFNRMLLGILAAGLIFPALGVVVLMRLQNSEFVQKRMLNQDVEISNRFQQMMIPDVIPVLPGWNIDVKFYTNRDVRSEFHDVLVLPDGKLMLVIGKMTGSGMVCALNIASLRAAFRTMAALSIPPSDALNQCNALIMQELQPGSRISCVFSILDPIYGTLTYAAAGPQQVFFCAEKMIPDGNQLNPDLGESWEIKYTQEVIALQQGDCLVFTTPGYGNDRNSFPNFSGEERPSQLPGQFSIPKKDALRALEATTRELVHESGNKVFEYTLILLERLPEVSDQKESEMISTSYLT